MRVTGTDAAARIVERSRRDRAGTLVFTIGTGFIFGDLAVAAIRISQQIFGIMVAGLQTFDNTLPRQLALLARDSDREPFLSFLD